MNCPQKRESGEKNVITLFAGPYLYLCTLADVTVVLEVRQSIILPDLVWQTTCQATDHNQQHHTWSNYHRFKWAQQWNIWVEKTYWKTILNDNYGSSLVIWWLCMLKWSDTSATLISIWWQAHLAGWDEIIIIIAFSPGWLGGGGGGGCCQSNHVSFRWIKHKINTGDW